MLKQLLARLIQRPQPRPADVQANADAIDAQALTFYRQQDLAAAEERCREILKISPRHAATHNLLGALATSRGDVRQAVAHFERAILANPRNAEYHSNCGEARGRAGHLTSALASCQAALRLDPVLPSAWLNLAHAYKRLGRLRESIEAFRKALRLRPSPAEHSTLLLLMNSSADVTPEEMLAEHLQWGRLYGSSSGGVYDFSARINPQKVLRIGYAHGNFARAFTEPILDRANRDHFRIFLYDNTASPDADTCRLHELADEWKSIAALSDRAAADLIERDGIDILVDLAGHSQGYRLGVFALKPAPVQATYLGYLNTTGVSAIDYRITDAVADPPGVADPFHVERLVRLAPTQWCYRPLADMPEVTSLPARSRGYVTFGSFNNFHKVNGEVQALWARLLAAIPDARLLVLGAPAAESCDDLRAYFASRGVDANRVTVRCQQRYEGYLHCFAEADIALDTFPFNGGTTTCEALWMGLPVITLAGRYAAARSGVSLLSTVGMSELLASSPDDYVSIAKKLASDINGLGALRSSLRMRMRRSALMDEVTFVHSLEDLYREMWRDWCAEAGRES